MLALTWVVSQQRCGIKGTRAHLLCRLVRLHGVTDRWMREHRRLKQVSWIRPVLGAFFWLHNMDGQLLRVLRVLRA
jgi:hypothetical protein